LEGPVKGDVFVVPFPFSDLSQQKRRPALVVARTSDEDILLCQITSRASQPDSVALAARDFEFGGLRAQSWIVPGRVFTADSALVLYVAGRIRESKLQEVIDRLISILKA